MSHPPQVFHPLHSHHPILHRLLHIVDARRHGSVRQPVVVDSAAAALRGRDGHHAEIPEQRGGGIFHGERRGGVADVLLDFPRVSILSCCAFHWLSSLQMSLITGD